VVRPFLIFKDRHNGGHATKAERLVKRLVAVHRIEDDFPVRGRQANGPRRDLLAKGWPWWLGITAISPR
jgi:hypothetical protein